MKHTVSKQDFALLVRQNAAQVIDFACRLLHSREDAEETAQDAFVKAFRQLDTFRGEATLLTWLLRITYNEALNRLRRQPPHTVDISDMHIADTADDEAPLNREERIERLEKAIGHLPPNDQLLLHLYYYDDRPLRDIAYIMDAPANALAVRLHRIRKRLQGMIKTDSNEQ